MPSAFSQKEKGHADCVKWFLVRRVTADHMGDPSTSLGMTRDRATHPAIEVSVRQPNEALAVAE